MAKKIPLQNGMFAIVDDEDYERCMEHVWYVRQKQNWIEILSTQKEKKIQLKKFILNYKGENNVFSKNKNPYDCRRENLFIDSRDFHPLYRRGAKNSTSKYRGVCWSKKEKKWIVQIHKNKITYRIGAFIDEDEAAEAYNKKALELFGDKAFQNVIGEDNRAVHLEVEYKDFRNRKHKNKRFVGVSLYKPSNKWRSRIQHNKKIIYLGYYDSQEEAARAYDKKARELFGDKAILNFPDEEETTHGKPQN